jgi:hypothetical protein
VIPESSKYPNNHKQAAFNYLLDRAHRMPITNEESDKEMEQTNAIATNNGYNINYGKRSCEKHKRKKPVISTDTSPVETKIQTDTHILAVISESLLKYLKILD